MQAVQLVRETQLAQLEGQAVQMPDKGNSLSGQVPTHFELDMYPVVQLRQVVDVFTQVLQGEVQPMQVCETRST